MYQYTIFEQSTGYTPPKNVVQLTPWANGSAWFMQV